MEQCDAIKKRVLITGALSGLGRAIAVTLQDSCELFLTGRYKRAHATDQVAVSGVTYSSYHTVDFSAPSPSFLTSLADIKEIDCLVHNASPYTEKYLFQSTNEDVEYFGQFLINSTLLTKNLPFSKDAKIVFIGSSASDPEYPLYSGGALYILYKSAIKVLAHELFKEQRFPCVLINPGLISTELPCPNNAVPSQHVVDLVKEAVSSNKYNNKVVPIYPQTAFTKQE